ncbi:hypothetical protein BDF20DRAFT_897832, partial [Mycotypha africana]|uniref:uncharacterized protein n=1 Tax=Mycotypha africana TaxID=64632 RepID=UPI002301CE9D
NYCYKKHVTFYKLLMMIAYELYLSFFSNSTLTFDVPSSILFFSGAPFFFFFRLF